MESQISSRSGRFQYSVSNAKLTDAEERAGHARIKKDDVTALLGIRASVWFGFALARKSEKGESATSSGTDGVKVMACSDSLDGFMPGWRAVP